MDFLTHLGEYLTGVAIVGLIGWVWALWRSHMNFKVHIAETYVRHTEIEDVKESVKAVDAKLDRAVVELTKTLQEVLGLCHELKGRAQANRT